jgi:DNA-binding NtrC family response regulator
MDLLFTDVVMPGGLFGPQLAAQALRLRPDLRVLYTSGYSEHPVASPKQLGPNVQMLNKPFRRQQLAATLRSALRKA